MDDSSCPIALRACNSIEGRKERGEGGEIGACLSLSFFLVIIVPKVTC